MKQLLCLFFLLVLSLGAGAQLRCQVVYGGQKTAQELITSLNDQYSHILYQNSVSEGLESSFFLLKKIRLLRLKLMLRDLNKNANGFDSFDVVGFVYRLDNLAFAHGAERQSSLSRRDQQILSEARRALLADGIVKNFNLNTLPRTRFEKVLSAFSTAFSSQYWRWLRAPTVMPKLVGLTLPLELAQKVAWEGLDAHRSEVEKYLPGIKTRSGFNLFSKTYNWLILTSMLTVVPYLAVDYVQEKIKEGELEAQKIYEPLVQVANEMALVDRQAEREVGVLEKYQKQFQRQHHRAATAEEISEAQKVIHQTILEEMAAKSE